MKTLVLRCLLLLAPLTLTPATFAQTAPARDIGAQQRTYAQGLLWKIESASGQTSHVFGTIHLSDARVLALPAPVAQSFEGAGSFVMEVTLDPANLMQLAGRMIFTDGRDLQGVLGGALFQKVAATAPSMGLPPEMLRYLKPWAVALVLMMPQTNGDNILDDRLYKMAIEQNKGVHQLETVDEQVDMFDRMAESEQIAMLRNAVENRERLPKLMERMVDTYLKRDLAALYRISEEDEGHDPEMKRVRAVLMQRLLDERNIRMADRADVLLKNGRAFIAVGALHLYGERGVLALLANRGYRVTRVY
jgi:uncharacterized protein YbaP (TraB family)